MPAPVVPAPVAPVPVAPVLSALAPVAPVPPAGPLVPVPLVPVPLPPAPVVPAAPAGVVGGMPVRAGVRGGGRCSVGARRGARSGRAGSGWGVGGRGPGVVEPLGPARAYRVGPRCRPGPGRPDPVGVGGAGTLARPTGRLGRIRPGCRLRTAGGGVGGGAAASGERCTRSASPSSSKVRLTSCHSSRWSRGVCTHGPASPPRPRGGSRLDLPDG